MAKTIWTVIIHTVLWLVMCKRNNPRDIYIPGIIPPHYLLVLEYIIKCHEKYYEKSLVITLRWDYLIRVISVGTNGFNITHCLLGSWIEVNYSRDGWFPIMHCFVRFFTIWTTGWFLLNIQKNSTYELWQLLRAIYELRYNSYCTALHA